MLKILRYRYKLVHWIWGKRKLTIEFLDNSPDTVAELICWALNLKCTREGDKLILSER